MTPEQQRIIDLKVLLRRAMETRAPDYVETRYPGWGDSVRRVLAGAATARRINAEPWQPLPGMEKRQCPWCRYFFAASPDVEEPRCPDCAGRAG